MIALVTGASRGIGREVCRQLAGLGFTVLAGARDPGSVKDLAGAEPLRLDVTSEADIQDGFRGVSGRFGVLDVLVNNAAITYDTWQRAADADLAVVREAAETNVYGPWRLTQVMFPLLRRSEHPRIVNVSSQAASFASMGATVPPADSFATASSFPGNVRVAPPSPHHRKPPPP